MTVNLSLLAGAGAQFFDNNGIPLAGGLVYTYTAGTTTPQAAYTTSAGSIAHANPIVLDSSGRVPSGGEIWLTDAVAYKFVLKTATATTIGTYDNVTGNASGIYAAFAASSGSSLVGFIQAGASAVATTAQAKLRQTVSVMDFGAVGDGSTNDTAAIQAAINTGNAVYFPKPSVYYNVTSSVVITVPFIAGLYKVFNSSANIKFGLQSVVEVFPEWFGAKPEADATFFDSTTAIQAAIDSTTTLNASTALNETTTLRVAIKFSMGVYYTNNLTVTHPIVIKGSGMKNTMIKTLNTNTNLVSITAVEPVEIYDLSFGVKDSLGAMTGGSFLLFDTVSFSNQYSKIIRVAFNNCYSAVSCIDSAFMIFDSCYFNRYSNTGIVIANTLTPDGGDSIITNCTFNNGTGNAILQNTSGGLRITNNKFLGGNYGYRGIYNSGFTNRTGQLIISDNSFDQCTVANISFDRLTDTTFSMILIEDNIIVTSSACTGVLVNGATAAIYLNDLTIGGNLFYLRNSATGIALASCTQVSVYPNHFKTDSGDTSTAILFSSSYPITNILVHPQSFMGATTLFSGPQTNVSFVPGKMLNYAGNPNNNITPNYVGEECLDTTNSKWYKSFGLAGNQWVALN